jgi:glycosyltransferase involved in cell wall biosynthesis
MILIDCLYVNNGGGKVLLDQLVIEVNKTTIEVQFLFDIRVINFYNHNEFKYKPLYLKANIFRRFLFYLNNKDKYSFIFSFGNIPPPIKIKVPTYTYLHNVLFLEKKKYLNRYNTLIIYIKAFYIKLILKNTNFWIVQTPNVQKKLSEKWDIKTNNIIVIPFFNNTFIKDNFANFSTKFTYLYVSNGENYKNHINLFKAFENTFKSSNNVILFVTISKNYKKLLIIINNLNRKGIPIFNLGILSKEDIIKIYQKTDVVIFPSLFESFGLGLVEAVQYKLPVISSNLDYVFEVIEPSLIFDPFDVQSISNALEYSITLNLKPSIIKIENKLNNLLEIFKNHTYEK